MQALTGIRIARDDQEGRPQILLEPGDPLAQGLGGPPPWSDPRLIVAPVFYADEPGARIAGQLVDSRRPGLDCKEGRRVPAPRRPTAKSSTAQMRTGWRTRSTERAGLCRRLSDLGCEIIAELPTAPGPHDNDELFDRFLRLAAADAGFELPERHPAPAVSAGGADAAA